jgi:nitric oxide reductase NorQ protein
MELITVINPKPQNGFVETPHIQKITERGVRYLRKKFPIHLSGPTGCGKTTLAFHIAYLQGRPVVLINGDEEFSTSSLIGGEAGYRKRKVVDRFVSRVYKSDESMTKTWIDDRLTTACKHGFTLIYNEFTRSRPEANNVFLSVLEERMLELPSSAHDGNYIKVHPDFSAIFTSNPEEYAGVFRSQDALMDRMITLPMSHYDEETEIAITQVKSGIQYETAKRIVNLVRRLRDTEMCEFPPTLRSCVAIGKALENDDDEEWLNQVCIDVLSPKIGKNIDSNIDSGALIREMLAGI